MEKIDTEMSQQTQTQQIQILGYNIFLPFAMLIHKYSNQSSKSFRGGKKRKIKKRKTKKTKVYVNYTFLKTVDDFKN